MSNILRLTYRNGRRNISDYSNLYTFADGLLTSTSRKTATVRITETLIYLLTPV